MSEYTGLEDIISKEELLNEDARYSVLSAVLGHPDHMVSKSEFGELIPADMVTIESALAYLTEISVLDTYHISDDAQVGAGEPSEFWGMTATGIGVLDRFGLLKTVPKHRAIYDAAETTPRMSELTSIPRPSLPDDVENALDFDDSIRTMYHD